jgi:uncharacterized RDD family membrane protein YckC
MATETNASGDVLVGSDKLTLKRRVQAVQVDVMIVGALCLLLLLAAGPLVDAPQPWWRWVAVVLGLVMAFEVFTGLSIGKRMAGVRLMRPDGTKAPWWALALRAVVRWVPVMIFMACLAVLGRPASVMTLFVAFVVVCCYVSGAYITVFRTGRTHFDMVAGTSLFRVDDDLQRER